MKKKLLLIVALCIWSGFVFSGCQATKQTGAGSETQASQIVPFSKGPSEPIQVKGPSGALPVNGSDQQAKAVTETEKIKYAIPGASTLEVN